MVDVDDSLRSPRWRGQGSLYGTLEIGVQNTRTDRKSKAVVTAVGQTLVVVG